MDLAGSVSLVSFIYVVTPRPKIMRTQTRLLPEGVGSVGVVCSVTVRPVVLELGVPLDGWGLVVSLFTLFFSLESLLEARSGKAFVPGVLTVVVEVNREAYQGRHTKSCIRNDLVQ